MIVVERTEADFIALAKTGYDPLELAPDGVDRRGKLVAKPWGHEIELHCEGEISVTRLELAAGAETSLHCHPGKSVLFFVSGGACELETLRVIYKLKAGDMARIARGAFHRVRTDGGAMLIEVESPPNKQNIVRLADRYGRGQGYEHEAAR